MSRKNIDGSGKSTVIMEVDPLECPFREFRDNELHTDIWGLSTAAFRAHSLAPPMKMGIKFSHEPYAIWNDEQTQPLPRSVRHYLHGWIRAEELALERWDAEVVIFEENNGGRMTVADMQLSHAQVLFRSSFCRKLLSCCFILERVDSFIVEHQWDYFSASFAEGWRAKYHIYSPGVKAGGGLQHKPGLSRNGCYLVRLFYLGAWRCIWVSDQVPVDTAGAPLLPFSPLLTHPPAKPGSKHVPNAVTASVIYLWPLLLAKALLKLAAPDMNSDENTEDAEDELMEEFDMMHAFTGAMNVGYPIPGYEELWTRIAAEVPLFSWDDDDETQASTIKSKSTRKQPIKDLTTQRHCMVYVILQDTKDLPPYHMPGITPGHEMSLLISMARDIPLKKPLPEPEVALWKYYRWVDWARSHGLYEAYDCPRTKFLKVNGLLKLSYAPHLLDVQSTESITFGFIEEHVKSNTIAGRDDDTDPNKKRKYKEQTKAAINTALQLTLSMKEELREWIQYAPMVPLLKCIYSLYYPSMFEFTSAGSHPPMRVTKLVTQKVTDIAAPKSAPLYLQLDGPEENKIKMSLNTLHPIILANTGTTVDDFIEPANFVLEKFEWFHDTALPVPKAYVRTRGYRSVEVGFEPGRHFFRIWTHSRLSWHLMLLSESRLILGSRDVIQGAAVRECPWGSKFLLRLGGAFTNWIKISRTGSNIYITDRDFFSSYLPDMPWNNEEIGYDRALLHWMFRQALQSHLSKRLNPAELRATCNVMRKYFCDPDFGFPVKPKPPRSVREIANLDICDCLVPEVEEIECLEEEMEQVEQATEEKPLVQSDMMDVLLKPPKPPVVSQICEMATEELPCGILKEEREKVIRKHEAAIVLQSYWRGTWARKCLESNTVITPDVMKHVQDHVYGSLEALSSLMNEFFGMYPGTKKAYSVASALSGIYGLAQHSGTSQVTPICKWIPYFQGVFYCHAPVKVHFDVHSSITHSTLAVYDNDAGVQLPQAYNAHITFDFRPNVLGYTILGHGSLNQAPGTNYDAHWQLTVMTSTVGAFHICDNEDPCKETILPHTSKFHLDEIFLPNRRNILGAIQFSVTKHEFVSFRASATSPSLEMVAVLRSILPDGTAEELSKCVGKGEIFWPYIRLEPNNPTLSRLFGTKGSTGKDLVAVSARALGKSAKNKNSSVSAKTRSATKMRPVVLDPKLYKIEVICPMGWPLTLVEWKRVEEVRKSLEATRVEVAFKKIVKEKEKTSKPGSAKEKEKPRAHFAVNAPQPGDASVELECSIAVGGGATAQRDDDRDIEFDNARKSWDSREPGRNLRGAQIRKEFRTEFLEVPPPLLSESNMSTNYDDEWINFEDVEGEENKKSLPALQVQGPTPATESGLLEMTIETEEEILYKVMPEQLRDKFIPLYFLPFCMKEKNEEESVVITPDMAEAAKKDRHARIEAAMDRMRELQTYNEEHVLGRQSTRCQLLEKLFVDASLSPELLEVMEQREHAMAEEVLNRNLSATRKKLELKKQDTKKVTEKRK